MYIASYPVRNESPPFLNAQFFNTCRKEETENAWKLMVGSPFGQREQLMI